MTPPALPRHAHSKNKIPLLLRVAPHAAIERCVQKTGPQVGFSFVKAATIRFMKEKTSSTP
jgi:hypothetical protein